MKVKTFSAATEKTLDKRINQFLNDPSLELIDIKFSYSIFTFSAMVIYK
ncbi:sporulation protein Cse60 [Bacillaceae bacterium W0354]